MDKIWLDHYQAGVPSAIDTGQYDSIVELFDNRVSANGDKTAFLCMGQRLTFQQFDQLAKDMASYFQHATELKPGDRVGLMLPNLLQFPVGMYGILRAGLTVVNINPLYTPRELKHQLKDSNCKAIIIAVPCLDVLEQVIADTEIALTLVTSPMDVMEGELHTELDPSLTGETSVSLIDALKQGRERVFNPVLLTQDDLAFLQYTGGTTGLSKGAELTHGNIVANTLQARAVLGPTLSDPDELMVTAIPLYHIFALTVNCMMMVDLGGANLLIPNPRNMEHFIGELQRHRVTCMTGVNTLFGGLLQQPGFASIDFSSWKIVIGGGSATTRAVADKWLQMTGGIILGGYGLTECSPLVTVNPCDQKHFTGSIGLPFPSTEIKIVDKQGKDLPIGETGELLVRGPQVMRGYWNRPESTAETIDSDGWLKTGDIVRIDPQGFLYLVDRMKDVIMVSGFNVYPNEIEDVVSMHPAILECAVVGVADEATGEAVKVYAVSTGEPFDESEMIEYCRTQLTGYKVPRIFEFVDALPKNTVGKILRRELRD